ncbi:MAG: PAS domain S-box protein, partial [Terriglobales bacterium]
DDFAVVLLDVYMPGLDGFETARRIRSEDRSKHTPIIFLTAKDSDDLCVTEAYQLGAVDYLVKPLIADILRAKVAVFVELARQARQIQWQAEQLRLAREEQTKRRAEASVRASEQRKAAILEAALDAIITMDSEGKVVEWNPAAEAIFGYRREAVVGREMAELIVPPPLRQRHYQGLAHFLATGEGPVLRRRLELTALRADGTEFPIELAITPITATEPILFTAYIRDITSVKQAEQALRAQREWLQVTLQSIGDAVIATDASGQVVFMNPIAESLTGWRQREAEGRPLTEVFHIVRERSRQPADNPVARVLRDGVVVGLANHTVLIGRDGIERPVDDSAAPIRDAEGRITGVVLVFRDVTERRQSEAALEERARLAAFGAEIGTALTQALTLRDMLRRAAEATVKHLDAAFARIWTVNEAGDMLELQASAGMYTHLDGPHSRVPVGRFKIGLIAQQRRPHLTNTVVGDPRVSDPEWASREGMVAFAGHPLIVEDRLVGVMAMFARHPLTSVELQALASVANEIAVGIERKHAEEALRRAHDELAQRVAERTAELARANTSLQEQIAVRRRAEAALQREEQFLKAVLENTADAVVACDADGILLLFNQAARQLHGLPAIALSADQWTRHYDLYQMDGVTPLDKEELPLFRALQEEIVRDVEMVIAPKGRPARFLLASGQAIYDGQGKKLGAVVSMHDITMRKRAEEERAALIREQAARAEAEAANRAKDEFLALLGHELRNPLGPIRNAVKLLTLKGNDSAVVEQARDIIGRQAEQMARLVDELLDASRIAQGKVQLKRETLDLAALIRTATGDNRAELESAGLKLAVEVPDAPVWVHGDAARLTQVVGNLLHNAQKFTDPGGRVTVRLAEEEGRAKLSIEDTGVGIAAEALPKLFEVFSQVDATLERSKGGLGLGLSVVKGLVELHGGQVRAASDGPGRGAAFTVWLPL